MGLRANRLRRPPATPNSGGIRLAEGVALALLAAVAGGFFGAHFTRNNDLEVAYKTQKLADIQTFQSSAKALDDSFRAFNDALVDGREVDSKRAAIRQAIAQHSSDAFGMERLFGRQETSEYMSRLAKFRREVDRVTAPTDAMGMAQTGIDLVSKRQQLTRNAEKRIGYQT